jgi:hypothetical protein
MQERNPPIRGLLTIIVITFILSSFSGITFSEVRTSVDTQLSDALTNIPELEDHSAHWDPIPEPLAPGTVYILVEPGIYPAISSEIDRYITDLTNEGWAPELHTEGWASVNQVKSLLQSGYAGGMQGAVFVGDIPIAWYEMDDWFGGVPYGYTKFPIELYYMDLDGSWMDVNLNGAFDEHLDGLGDLQPEIWVGRILTSTLTLPGETEATLIRNYFAKNHEYRMGNLPLNDRALVYVDDDWAAWGTEYSNDVGNRYAIRTLVNDNEVTRTADYLNRLDDNYDWISLFAHSWPGGHGFYYNGGSQFEYLYNEQISAADPMAHFYNLFCCSAANYSDSESEGYITGHYVFAQSYGLGAVASTKTGSMLNFADFYIPLGTGESIGQAFLDWFILNGETGAAEDSRAWFYGMTVIGDPTLDTYDDGPPSVPDVTVMQPNTPLTWSAGSSQEITWTATPGNLPLDPAPISIYYSYDDPEGDGPWTIIASSEENDGTYTWAPVPNTPSTECWVKVEARDTGGKVGSDTSDVAFEIMADLPPMVDLTCPDGLEIWMGGISHTIYWNMSDEVDPFQLLTVDILYSTDSGATYPNTIASGLTGYTMQSCTYDWNPVPSIDCNQLRVKVVVTDTGSNTYEDESMIDFTIDSTHPEPATDPYAELEGIGVRIYWTASPSADIDHYEVWWRMNDFDPTGNSYPSYLDAGFNTDVLHPAIGINNANSYTYQIRTYDIVGHETRTVVQAAKFGSTQNTFAREPDWFMLGSSLVQSDTSLVHVLQGQGLPANWECIRTYNGFSDTWATQVKYNPRNTITDIYTDQGFWLYIGDNTRFASAGYIDDKAIPLSEGWNLVAYPFAARSMSTAAIETHLSANCPGYEAMLIEDLTNPYHLKTPGGTESINHNQAFWLHVTADTTWTVLNY